MCRQNVGIRIVAAVAALAAVAAARAQYEQLGSPLQMGIRNWEMSNYAYGTTSAQKHAQGRARIKAGKATTRFAPRAFPLELWFRKWAVEKDPAERKKYAGYWTAQKAILDRELKARGDDMGELFATLFVIAYEGYSGERAKASQYWDMAASSRGSFLRNEYFQGEPNGEKVDLAEGEILDATAAASERRDYARTGNPEPLEKARSEAKKFIDRWWSGGLDNLKATPARFVTAE